MKTKIWTIFVVVAGLAAAPAATVYWGGGTVDITDGTPPSDVGGDWSQSISNWASDALGTTYQTWNNAAGDTARFDTSGSNYSVLILEDITTGGG